MRVTKAIKPWRYPEASERQLSRSISGMAEEIGKRAEASVRKMKFDATDEEIDQEESDLAEYILAALTALYAMLRPMGLSVYRFNTMQWIAVAMSAGGGNNPVVASLKETGATQLEPWLIPKLNQWESLSAASLKKLADAMASDWSTNVRLLNLQGKKSEAVEDAVKLRVQVWKSWSANRARGIVGTWNSVLMRQRLDDAGVTSYLWRGMLDERERPLHLSWEGKEVDVETDHVFPGEPYGCRCWAQPKFKAE